MRVLVMGGNRYIGRHLVFELARQGHDVTVMNSHEAPLPAGARRIHGDRRVPGVIHYALSSHRDDFDVVFDNTAYTVGDLEPMVDLFRGRVSAVRVHELGRGLQAQLHPAGQRVSRHARGR